MNETEELENRGSKLLHRLEHWKQHGSSDVFLLSREDVLSLVRYITRMAAAIGALSTRLAALERELGREP